MFTKCFFTQLWRHTVRFTVWHAAVRRGAHTDAVPKDQVRYFQDTRVSEQERGHANSAHAERGPDQKGDYRGH